MSGAYRLGRLGRVSAAVLMVLAVVLPSSSIASASVPMQQDAALTSMRVLPERLPTAETDVGDRNTRQLWLWPDGRRAFQLDRAVVSAERKAIDTSNVRACSSEPPMPEKIPGTSLNNPLFCRGAAAPPPTREVMQLVAHDLDTHQEVARRTVDPLIDVGDPSFSGGHSSLGAVDQAGGRLFLPYASTRIDDAIGYPQSYAGRNAAALAQGSETCPPGVAPAQCVAGVLVIDGTTLETIHRIPLRSISVDGGSLRPAPRLVEYIPGEGPDGAGGKAYMVVEETQHAVLSGTNSPSAKGANLAYLVQFDVDAGRQDWAVRLDGCRYNRDSISDGATLTWDRGNAAALVRTDQSIWVACHSGAAQGAVVRVPLNSAGAPATLPVEPAPPALDGLVRGGEPQSGGLDPSALISTAGGQEVFPGPEGTVEVLGDAGSGRLLFRVVAGAPLAEVWWVFDPGVRNFVGTLGIGRLNQSGEPSTAGLDPERGRLYVFVPPYAGVTGGMYVADIRRTPLPQPLIFPHIAGIADWNLSEVGQGKLHNVRMAVDPGGESRLPRVYWRYGKHTAWTVIEDGVPFSEDALAEGFAGRTLDLEEVDGVTATTYDGAARGYGARLLLVGGLEGAGRAGPLDAGAYEAFGPTRKGSTGEEAVSVVRPLVVDPCGQADRELVLASVGGGNPAVVDVTGGRGSARPVSIDSTMAADLEAPVSRCAPLDWDSVWAAGLFGRAPAGEPAVPSTVLFGKPEASCLSSDEASGDSAGSQALPVDTDAVGDPVGSPFAARVDCDQDEVSGWSYARLGQLGDVAVSSAYASFRLYRDPGRGVVARVESVTRGVAVPAALRVDTVRTIAESWANGRRQPMPAEERAEGYDPNCDIERSAGSCFRRHMFGVWTPGYQCGPCGDEGRVEQALTKALGSNGAVRLRKPDPRMARGAENGFTAAVQKPDHERFADLVLNNDLLQTVVPGLEIIRYANPGIRLNPGAPRARQIYQFAGVEVSSSYGISCLLVYDEATNTCGAAKEDPGSIIVNLTDADGKALAGGAFEVRTDADTDGVVGLKDALLPNGACVTADDGVGTCKFDALQPGSYLVSQVAAPPGFGKVADPFVVELASGEARTVTFENTSNVSTIAVSAADEAGKPVSGAQFAVYGDPDSDGKVAADAKPVATCTTDASGSCSMQVPAGSYVLVQTAAPGGLEPIEPVAFTFASGGQTAAVGIVNYPAGGVPAVEPAASPVEYSAPPAAVVTESVDDYQPATEVAEEPQVSIPDAVGGTIVRVIQAPGDALRLLSRDPKQAVAWTASLMLFALAVMAVRRRRQAIELIRQ